MLPEVGDTDWIDQTAPNTFNFEVLDLLRTLRLILHFWPTNFQFAGQNGELVRQSENHVLCIKKYNLQASCRLLLLTFKYDLT